MKNHPESKTVDGCLRESWELLKKGKLKQTHISAAIKKALKGVYGLDDLLDTTAIIDNSGDAIGDISVSQQGLIIKLEVFNVTDHQKQEVICKARDLI